MIGSALRSLSLPPQDLEGLEAELRRDHASLPIEHLGLDSLGRMEFCIHLELDHGVVITPETLITLKTVAALIESIQAQLV